MMDESALAVEVEPLISFNDITGIHSDNTMQLHISVGNTVLTTLLNCSSTHNFISLMAVRRIGLCFMDNQGTHVVVTNGDHFSFHGHALTSPSASATNTSSLTAMPSHWTTTTWFWE